MYLLENTQKYCVDTEDQAKDLIEEIRAKAAQKGYNIKKAGFERKDKKAKGEIVATCYVVTITELMGTLWEDL